MTEAICFSKSKEGNVNVSPNFKVREFAKN